MTDQTPPTDSADEVNMCKGCGTMKHINAEGYCGRCVGGSAEGRSNPMKDDGELRDKVTDMLGTFDIDFGYAVGNLNMDTTLESRKELTDAVVALVKAERANAALEARLYELDRMLDLSGSITMMITVTEYVNTRKKDLAEELAALHSRQEGPNHAK